MTRLKTPAGIALLLILLPTLLSAFQDFSLSLYDNDSVAVSRPTGYMTAGLPFAKGELTSLNQIAVYNKDKTQEIPVQLTPIVNHADGSYQWVIADFQAPIVKGDTNYFWVRNMARSAVQANPIIVDSSASAFYVNTGVMRFRVNRSNFNLIDSLWLGSKLMIGGNGGGIKANDGADRWGTSVTRSFFEYLGPVRATLRIDGTLSTAASGGLTYRVRIHAYAGSSELKIETSIRNTANATAGANATLTGGGFVYLPLASTFAATRAASKDTLVQAWQTTFSFYQDAASGMIAAARYAGGYTNKMEDNSLVLSGNTLAIGIARTAQVLPDLATVDKQVFLKFYSGTQTEAQVKNQIAFWRNPTYAIPAVSRITETGGLPIGKFGDFKDEKAVMAQHNADPAKVTMFNTGWGLHQMNTVPNPPDGINAPINHLIWDCPLYKFDYSYGGEPFCEDVHGEMEQDPLQGNILTWIRTGNTNIYKWVFAWANYFKTLYSLRTDGYEYDGQYSVSLGINGAAKRMPKTYSLTGFPCNARCDEIPQAGAYACHLFGWGLGDYFCLTGDYEARDALLDMAEVAWINDKGGIGGGGTRGFCRRWMLTERAYEITRDASLLTRFNAYEQAIFKENFDPRGFYWNGGAAPGDDISVQRLFADNATKPYLAKDYQTITPLGLGWITNSLFTQYKNGAQLAAWRPYNIQTWEHLIMAEAAMRSYQITGSEAMRDLTLGLADFMMKWGWSPICKRNEYGIVVDFPLPDSIRTSTFATCDVRVHKKLCDSLRFLTTATAFDSISNTASVQAHHSGYQDFLWVNTMCNAYEFTGGKKYLDRAWRDWSNGSRTIWNGNRYSCDTGNVATYSYDPGWNGWDLAGPVVNLFYTDLHHKTDDVAPSAVTDLVVHKTGVAGEWQLFWTSPSDVGAGGEVLIKYDTVPVLEYDKYTATDYYKYSYTRDAGEQLVGGSYPFKATAWWLAKNAAGEPVPAPSLYQNFKVTVNQPTVYFALCTRDAAGNLSPISNLVKGDPTTTAIEEGEGLAGPVSMETSPNPFNPAVSVAFTVPVAGANKVRVLLEVFGVDGRKIATLADGMMKPGLHTADWNSRAGNGQCASGVYFLKLSMENKVLLHKIVMAK